MQRSVCVGALYPTNIITRRGLACVAYPYLEAMRRPDCRDKREETTPTPFYFHTQKMLFSLNLGVWKHYSI